MVLIVCSVYFYRVFLNVFYLWIDLRYIINNFLIFLKNFMYIYLVEVIFLVINLNYVLYML